MGIKGEENRITGARLNPGAPFPPMRPPADGLLKTVAKILCLGWFGLVWFEDENNKREGEGCCMTF